jgi:hypothetical protein
MIGSYGIISRRPIVPFVVFVDAKTGKQRCISALHVQTFVPDPSSAETCGTIVTFTNGDAVRVEDDFNRVFTILTGFADG